MSREVRMVPAGWRHPKYFNHHRGEVYRPMHDTLHSDAMEDWVKEKASWDSGAEHKKFDIDPETTFVDWHGEAPDSDDYMPYWPDALRTHFQMYECTSEGTPLSPPMESAELLAQWCVDHNVSPFGTNRSATYEQWLRVAKGGWAPSAVMDSQGLRSGVEALGDK